MTHPLKHAMIQETATVLWNRPVSSGYAKIGLTCTPTYLQARPGQFVTLRLPDQTTPLLRRPFSIHRCIGGENEIKGIEILYKIVGPFTRKLSQAKEEDRIDLLGPLGHGFTVSDKYHSIALVAGGIGIAPLVFLHEAFINLGFSFATSAVFIGGRSQSDILCTSDFHPSQIHAFITTEDGSDGETGMVVAPLSRWLKSHRPDMMYACGPMPMLKAVIAIARLENIACEVSVETIMACGIGACLGCAIQTNRDLNKFKHVCVDGPVFNAMEFLY
jgi:dihydroorotate dehydrogenase electron transfer subunit